jgi:hypothetical protein
MTEIVGMPYLIFDDLIFDVFANSMDDRASIDAYFGDSAETWILGRYHECWDRTNPPEEAGQRLRLS